jgi:type IV pilus assembly protein PilM
LGKDGAYPKVDSSWVVAGLPEPQTFLKLIDIPTPAKDLVYEEVSFHASKHLPFDIQDTYLDWQVLNPEEENKNSRVLIAAVPKNIADSYTYLLEAAELNPLALEAEAISVARTLITSNKDYSGIARILLDLGGTRSSIIIYDNDSIQFSKSVDFSGELFTTAISQGLKISREEAERLKIASGLNYNKDFPNYIKIADDTVEKLIEDINRTLRFYKEHFPDANDVTHITMSGGFSCLNNLDNVLSKRLRISAHPGNVLKNLNHGDPSEEDKAKSLEFATAIGLALRAAQNPLLHKL